MNENKTSEEISKALITIADDALHRMVMVMMSAGIPMETGSLIIAKTFEMTAQSAHEARQKTMKDFPDDPSRNR